MTKLEEEAGKTSFKMNRGKVKVIQVIGSVPANTSLACLANRHRGPRQYTGPTMEIIDLKTKIYLFYVCKTTASRTEVILSVFML